jgi:hypothetical protein
MAGFAVSINGWIWVSTEVRAARPRTFDQVCDLIAAALGLFTPKECRNFVRHCGYRVATTL